MFSIPVNCVRDTSTPAPRAQETVEVERQRCYFQTRRLRRCFHWGAACGRPPAAQGQRRDLPRRYRVPLIDNPELPPLYARPARAAGGAVVVLDPWEFSVGAGVRPPRGARRRRENSGSGAGEVSEVQGISARLGGWGSRGSSPPPPNSGVSL